MGLDQATNRDVARDKNKEQQAGKDASREKFAHGFA